MLLIERYDGNKKDSYEQSVGGVGALLGSIWRLPTFGA